MHPRGPDPLTGTDRLLLDGSNLLHALRRDAGPAAPPASALVGRLRAAVPPAVGIELVLDGAPDPGMHNTRVASGLIVRYAGRRSADELILGLVEEAARAVFGRPTGSREGLDNILVVTDDRDLRLALRDRGVRTAGTRWLLGRLERRRLDAPATGNRRPPPPAPSAGEPGPDEADAVRWQPGRGATTKRGNPRRKRAPR